MDIKDIDKKINQLLRLLFELNTNKGPLPRQQFEKLMKKWQLGASSMPEDRVAHSAMSTSCVPSSSAATMKVENLNDTQLPDEGQQINQIKQLAADLLHNLEPLLIHLLYVDAKRVLSMDGQIDPHEEKVFCDIENIWATKLSSVQKNGVYSIVDEVFAPQHSIVALGYLFWAAIIIDGHIHTAEIDQMIENTTTWRNENARIIFSALKLAKNINQGQETYVKESEQESAQDRDVLINKNFKQSVINCLEFLKNKSNKQELYKQIMYILEADGVIHKNEEWFIENLRQKWGVF